METQRTAADVYPFPKTTNDAKARVLHARAEVASLTKRTPYDVGALVARERQSESDLWMVTMENLQKAAEAYLKATQEQSARFNRIMIFLTVVIALATIGQVVVAAVKR